MTGQTKAQEKLLSLVNNQELAKLVGSTLAEIAVELMDAKGEAAHWKAAFEAVRDEIKILVAVSLRQRGASKLVITEKELRDLPQGTQLYVGNPEPGVRIYELGGARNPIDSAVDGIIRLN
jgi:hypothetical protein